MFMLRHQLGKRISQRVRRIRLVSYFEKRLKRNLIDPLFRAIIHPSNLNKSSFGLRLFFHIRNPPLLSVLIPVYKPDLLLLEKSIASVQKQFYPNWELCIVDDGSNDEQVTSTIRKLSEDKRIKFFRSEENKGISAAVNKAAAMAKGEYLGVLDQDDELHTGALLEYARVIQHDPEVDIIYCDENKIDETGEFCWPWLKPDWNPDLALSFNYVMHFVLYRSSLFHALGGMRPRFDGSQDYDLLLRAVERTKRIRHIPKIRYHWRMSKNSIATGPEAKPYVFVNGLAALNDALRRRGIQGTAEHAPDAWDGVYRVRRNLQHPCLTSILVILSAKGPRPSPLLRSLESFVSKEEREIICMDLSSSTAEGADMTTIPYTCVNRVENAENRMPACFNAMAGKARGDFLFFLDDTMEIASSETLHALLEHGQRPEVGAVGGKIRYRNGLVEHTGIIMGPFGLLGYANRATPDDAGYVGNKRMIANCSAVMGLGMLTPRLLFLDQGGFDERYRRYCWDADYCLRLREKKFLITFTPYAILKHHVDVQHLPYAIPPQDRDLFRKRWQYVIDNDPYFNKNLSRSREDFWPID